MQRNISFKKLPTVMCDILMELPKPEYRLYLYLLKKSGPSGWTGDVIDFRAVEGAKLTDHSLLSRARNSLVSNGIVRRKKMNKKGGVNQYCVFPTEKAKALVRKDKANKEHNQNLENLRKQLEDENE